MTTNLTNPMTRLTVGALLVAAVGISLQYLSGAGNFPTIPPGPIILVVLAAIVTFVPWRWVPLLGTLMGAALIVGFFATGTADRFLDLSPFAAFSGLWIEMIASVVAIIVGALAVTQDRVSA